MRVKGFRRGFFRARFVNVRAVAATQPQSEQKKSREAAAVGAFRVSPSNFVGGEVNRAVRFFQICVWRTRGKLAESR